MSFAAEGAGTGSYLSEITISGAAPFFVLQAHAMLLRRIESRTDEHKAAVVLRLLQMSKGRGAPLAGVWWDDGLPRVRYALWGEIEILTWPEAEEMTGVYGEPATRRKPMGREVGLRPVRLASGY